MFFVKTFPYTTENTYTSIKVLSDTEFKNQTIKNY